MYWFDWDAKGSAVHYSASDRTLASSITPAKLTGRVAHRTAADKSLGREEIAKDYLTDVG